MTKLSSMFLSAVLIALPVSSMAAYEGGDVKDGGTISGTVKFKGTAPAPKKLDVSKDKEVCGKTPKTDQSLVVDNGNLVNAVVTITDIKKGKKIEVKKVTLDQNGCAISPTCVGLSSRFDRRDPKSGRDPSQHPLLQQGKYRVQYGSAQVQEDHGSQDR